jgi:hypothetical protein
LLEGVEPGIELVTVPSPALVVAPQ